MTREERQAADEAMTVAALAGNVAGHMKQVGGMSSAGSNPSKAGVIDPRKFLPKNLPPGAGRPPAPVNGSAPALTDDALKPRLGLIPLPEGVTAEDVVAPFRPAGQQAPAAAPTALPERHPDQDAIIQSEVKRKNDAQLELEFDKQATLNEINSRIDSLISTMNTLVYTVEQLSKHVIANTESGKKKYRARESSTSAVGESNSGS